MSKFCANCGSQQPDEANVCGNCGNAFAPENVVPQQVVTAKSKKPLIIAAVAIVAVIAIVLVLLFSGGGVAGSPEEAIENRLDYLSGDVSYYEYLAPQAYWEWREEKDDDFNLEETIEEMEEMIAKAEENGLAKDINYDYEVLKEKDLTEAELKKIKKGLKNIYDISEDSVTDGVKFDIELTIESDGKERSEKEKNIYIVEIDGGWYIVSESGSFLV